MTDTLSSLEAQWQVTQAEWIKDRERASIRDGWPIDNFEEWARRIATMHKRVVGNALRAGLDVPPDVLADYPEYQ